MLIDDLGGVTAQAVRLALDAAVLRHQVAAHNIANASTPGYEATRVSFESLLEAANVDMSDEAAVEAALDRAREQLGRPGAMEKTGEAVELDAEMVHVAENTLRYQALLRGLSSRMAIMKLAVRQGRE